MPQKDHKSNRKQKIDPSTIEELINKSVQTASEAQQANLTSVVTDIVREAVRKEMDNQRLRKVTSDSYTQRLEGMDAKVTGFIQQSIEETTRAYRYSVTSYVVSHIVALSILIAGAVMLFSGNMLDNTAAISLGLIAIGSLWIISLQNRNPVKNSRHMVNHLAKLNVIFAGYIRQIHQVDAVFEEFVASGKELTVPVVQQLLSNLQDAMTEAMNAITAMTNLYDDQ